MNKSWVYTRETYGMKLVRYTFLQQYHNILLNILCILYITTYIKYIILYNLHVIMYNIIVLHCTQVCDWIVVLSRRFMTATNRACYERDSTVFDLWSSEKTIKMIINKYHR